MFSLDIRDIRDIVNQITIKQLRPHIW